MHSYISKDKTVTFHYNADFSGNVIMFKSGGESIEVSGESLLQFVAYCYVIPKRISIIEDMDYLDALSNIERMEKEARV